MEKKKVKGGEKRGGSGDVPDVMSFLYKVTITPAIY